MVFIETVFQFNGPGVLIFICASESNRCAVIMDLFCFKQIYPKWHFAVNSDIKEFRSALKKQVKVFGNLIVIVN